MLEWDDLRLLLAVARHGSLTAASRVLGVTQPTMSRRLENLEVRLGASLFERHPTGVALNGLGTSMLEAAEAMEQSALAAERRLAARGEGLDGVVRITTLEWIGHHVLAPSLARFGCSHPGVIVELLTSDRVMSLARHEADLAVRQARFDQDGLVQRKLGDLPRGVYASAAYLNERGIPDFAAGCPGHALIILPEMKATMAQVHWLRDEMAPQGRVAIQSNSLDVQLQAALAGAGLVVLPRRLGDGLAGLRRLETPEPPPAREMWLGFHQDMRHTPRVRALATHLAADIRA